MPLIHSSWTCYVMHALRRYALELRTRCGIEIRIVQCQLTLPKKNINTLPE